MVRIIGIILAIWLAIALIGFVVKALFWVGVIALVAFAATAAVGWTKRNSITR